MFRSKTVARIVGVVVLLALAVGCAPTASPEPTTPPPTQAPEATTPPEEPTPAPTEPPKPVTLKLWKYASSMPNQADWVNEMIQQYMEENPHVTIVYEEMAFATYDNEALPTAFAAAESPDVFWTTRAVARTFYEQDQLVALDDYLSEDYKSDMLPQALEAAKWGGKIYIIPFEMDLTGICYRTDLWQEAGLTEADIPKTWGEFIDVATRLTTPEHYGIYLAPSATPHSQWQFISWVWMGGGDVVDEELTTVLYDSQATVDALRLWGDLMNQYKAMVPTALGIGESMGTGKAVMEFCAIAHIGLFDARYPEIKDKVSVFALPLPAGGARAEQYGVYGGYNLAVSAQSKSPEEAARFAAWLMAEDPVRPARWVTFARPGLSPRASVRETAEYQAQLADPRFGNFMPMLDTARADIDAPMDIVMAVVESEQAVLYGNVSPEQAARAAAEKMQEYIDSRH